MIFIISFTYILYPVLIFLSRKEKASGEESKAKGILTRIAAWLYHSAPFEGLRSDKVRENLNILHPAKNTAQLLEKYYVEKIRRILLLFFAGNAVITALYVSAGLHSEIQGQGYIMRGKSGSGDKTIDMTAYMTGEETVTRSPISITVTEQSCTPEELKQFVRELKQKLSAYILGDNKSLDEVREPLLLQSAYGDNPIAVSWMSSDYGLIDADGSVYNEQLKEPVSVLLTAQLSYGGRRLQYDPTQEDANEMKLTEEEAKTDEAGVTELELEIPVMLYPKEYTSGEQRLLALQEQLRHRDEETVQSDRMELPKEVDGYEVRFVERKGQSVQILWILLVFVTFLLYKQADECIGQQAKRREEALLSEYPEFVSKLTLLVNAGMTVRGAITRIVNLYEAQNRNGEKPHPCCEELRITLNEMENGVYEEKAYENLGRRIRLPVYVKLSGLLSQNVRKGSKDLLLLLNKEAKDAFEERKAVARMLGEEAGTKLLLPMMLMLAVVLLLIIVPAFLSYPL